MSTLRASTRVRRTAGGGRAALDRRPGPPVTSGAVTSGAGTAAAGTAGAGMSGAPVTSGAGTAGAVSGDDDTPEASPSETSTAELDALVGDWATVPDIAAALDADVTKVRQYLREGQLAAVRRGERRVLSIPAAFVADGRVVKGLPGTLTVLADNGYSVPEAITWLFTPEETLPGSPITALRENRGTEVRRRAQALAF